MDIAKDLMASLRDRVAPQGKAPGSTPVWSELHARFCAAHAAASQLSLEVVAVPAGGFGQWKRSGERNASCGVNRTDSADGKSVDRIGSEPAEENMTGGRGQR